MVALVKVVMTTYESIFCSREGRVQRLAMQYDVLHKLYCCNFFFFDVVCMCVWARMRMHHIIQNHIDCYLV